MPEKPMLKFIHLAGTVWFILCVGYILVLALRQAGVNWWVIFSLSGHSALLIFLMVSLYLFAIFRGVGGNQKPVLSAASGERSRTVEGIEVEHPLTSTNYYIVFYIAAPFLGGLAGCLGMIGEDRIVQFLLGITLGTLGTTFLVWVFVDPVAGLLEMLLPPASRKHRAKRLAEAKAQREEKQKARERLLTEVLAKEESARHCWQQVLRPQAEKLAALLMTNRAGIKQAEREAVDIGVNAWRVGGLSCMQQLRDMAITIDKQKNQSEAIVDYIPVWWDGIGSWRNPSLR
jgi:hypothetical protein